jgi:hypothetical protein
MKNIVSGVMIGLLLFSCKPEKSSLAEKDLIFDDKNEISLRCEKFIPLETSDDCTIGFIEQLEIVGDRIFVLDAFVSKKLYVFDLDGRFITHIGTMGSGPEEYLFPRSFGIHSEKHIIEIDDPQQNVILFYDLDSYAFIQKRRVPFYFGDMGFLNDGNYLFIIDGQDMHGEITSHFIVTDTDFNIINKFIHIDFSAGHLIQPYKYIYTLAGKTYGFLRFGNIVYEIQSDTIIPQYSIALKKHSFPPLALLQKETESAFNSNYVPWLMTSGYAYSCNVIETDAALCVDYMANKERYVAFYNKENEHSYSYGLKRFQEISGVCGIEKVGGRSDDGFLVAVVSPSMLLNQMNNKEFYSEKAKQLYDHITPEDNPVLYVFKFN